MVWTDRFTEMVIGRGLADQLEKARLEKMYEGAEQRLKQTTQVSCEPRPEAPKYKGKGHIFHRTESLPLELPQEGTLRPRRPKLQRSQSDIVEATRSTTTPPSGPPNITVIDLSHGHIHRVYSQADVHFLGSTQMPPLEPMIGFGKYRRSIHAHPEWQMQQYRTNLRDFPGLIPQLGDFKLADPDPVIWDQFCQESARSNSFASSTTSNSNSSEGPMDGATERRTGPIVTRGFVPSITSSAASSFRDNSSGHIRKDSALSMTSPSEESDNKLVRFPSRQSTLSLLGEPTTLTAINEDLAGDPHHGCKVSQILKYNIEGDVEKAVESDYEDELDCNAAQMGGTQSGVHSTGPLTLKHRGVERTKLAQKALIERAKWRDSSQRKPREFKSELDRSITVIRKPLKPALRRTLSRGKPQSSRRLVTSQNAHVAGEKLKPTGRKSQELTSSALSSSDDSRDAHEHRGDLGVYMAGAKDSTFYQLAEKEDSKGSFESNCTKHALTAEIVPNLPANCAIKTRRNRPHTVVRIDSETA